MAETTFWEARANAVLRAFEADPRAIMIGAYFTAPFNPPDEVVERLGDRVLATPTSEMAVLGVGVGAAMAGLRPLIPVNTASFVFYGWPQLVSEAPNVRYLSGGTVTAPVIFHMFAGARRAGGVQHEHTPQAMLQNVPGLRIYAPATPADVDGLFAAAFASDDPVVMIDHLLLAETRGAVPDVPDTRIGASSTLRTGGDLVIITYSLMVQRALEAADRLSGQGIDASVVNLRTLAPLPVDDVLAAVASHPAALVLARSRLAGSPAATLVAAAANAGVATPMRLVCTHPAPSPFSTDLLDEVVPTVGRIVEEATRLVGGQPPG